jgi:cyclohexanecarboxyl-CoA dehydrogenase
MPLNLSEDQIAFRDTARRFAREKLAPGYMDREKTGVIERGLMREMGSLGLIGADLPEKFGGVGASGVTVGLITEEIAYGDFSVSYAPLLVSLMGNILLRHAQPAVAAEFLPKMTSGEVIVGLGLTEPRGGSDAANLIVKAERSGNGYVINGEKTSISFSDQADYLVLFARTGRVEDGARGVSAFLVPMNEPGVSRTRFDDFGTKGVGRGSVFFDNVKIPGEFLIGQEGQGFVQVMQGFDYSRVLIALECIAPAQASVDESWKYIQERQAFGVALAQYQGVTFPLAEADTLLAAARELCYYTLGLRDQGLPHTAEAAMCKWFAPKTAVDVIHQCLLTHGHYGYTNDLPHQQRLRDVIGLEIGDGTAQIMKLIIAREKIGRIAVQYAKQPKS